jgi:hypothetical protein
MPVYIIFRKYKIEADNPHRQPKNCWMRWMQKRMRITTSQIVSVSLMSQQVMAN